MSYVIEPRKLKKLVQYYSAQNNSEQIKFLKVFEEQKGLLRHLQTSPFQGIDSTSIQQRRAQFGSNKMSFNITSQSLPQMLLSPLTYLSSKIIVFLSILSFVSGIMIDYNHLELPWMQGLIFFLCFIGYYILILIPQFSQRYANRLIKKYQEQQKYCIVWRDNEKFQISTSELVVGDIVQMEASSFIGADGLLIEGHLIVEQKIGSTFKQAEKMIRKQCIEKIKVEASKKNFISEIELPKRPSPIVIGGSTVKKGQGRMIVLCVGKYSRRGYKAMLVHHSAKNKISKTQQKVKKAVFTYTKYAFLALIVELIFIILKKALFIAIQKQFNDINWQQIIQDLLLCVITVLTGIPSLVIIGLAIIMALIKYQIWKNSQVYFKCAKDCQKFDDLSTIIYEMGQEKSSLNIKNQWQWDSQSMQQIQIEYNRCYQYDNKLIESLMCENFDPYEVGLQLSSFWIGINQRQYLKINQTLQQYGKQIKLNQKKRKINSQLCIESIQSQCFSQKQSIQLKYFKGNAETILKVCSHFLDKQTGKIQMLTQSWIKKLQKQIWNINLNEGISIICGFMQVNTQHPRYRQGNSRVVLVNLLQLQVNKDIEEFQALKKIRKTGINVMLISQKQHQQTMSRGKELGIISVGKPSINLKGYDLYKVTGGIICKFCKKSVCLCPVSNKFQPNIKNQDYFTSIQKHICTISQANMIQKLALVLGFRNSNKNACFMGSQLEDIPAMKASQISIHLQNSQKDSIISNIAQVNLKKGSLSQIRNLFIWSLFSVTAIKKYLILYFTSCIVAFSINFLGLVLFDTTIFNLIQCMWVSIVICPLLGSSFASVPLKITQDVQLQDTLQIPQNQLYQNDNPLQNNKQNIQNQRTLHYKIIFDRYYSRHLSSQIIFQTIVLAIILFFGQKFIPESVDSFDEVIGDQWYHKYQTEERLTVCWGIRNNIFQMTQKNYQKTYDTYQRNSRHLTFIFNLYVLLQFMNYLICRICHKESLNFLQNLNCHSIFVFIFAIALQFIFVQFSGGYAGLYPQGLTLMQWIICLGLSLLGCILGIIIKQIPQEQDKQGEKKFKFWPNRAYNLAVMTVIPRETLLQFQVDQQFEMQLEINKERQ